jgi:dTDP-4-amino-4,6-dideoxygalactose transaminase
VAFALKQVGWSPPPDMKPAGHYGHNYRITEMQCVLLRAGLSRLPEQTARRDENAQYLAAELAKLGGPLRAAAKRDPRVTRQAYYAMSLHFDAAQAEGVTRAQYVAALTPEGLPLGGVYDLVYSNPLLNLYDRTSPIPYRQEVPQRYDQLHLPVCEQVKHETGLVLIHPHLLAEQDYIDQLVEAVAKVNDQTGGGGLSGRLGRNPARP